MGVHRGVGVPLRRIGRRIWKEVEEVLLFVVKCDGSHAFARGKSHEIDEQNDPNDEIVRQKTRFIATRVKSAIAREQCFKSELLNLSFSNLTRAETRTVGPGLVK